MVSANCYNIILALNLTPCLITRIWGKQCVPTVNIFLTGLNSIRIANSIYRLILIAP